MRSINGEMLSIKGDAFDQGGTFDQWGDALELKEWIFTKGERFQSSGRFLSRRAVSIKLSGGDILETFRG